MRKKSQIFLVIAPTPSAHFSAAEWVQRRLLKGGRGRCFIPTLGHLDPMTDRLMARSDEVVVCVQDGVMTEVMQGYCDVAIRLGIPLRWHSLTVNDVPELHTLEHLPTDAVPPPCDLMSPDVFAAAVTTKFAVMAKRLEAGEFYEDVDAGLDDLLGTELSARDRDVETAWQKVRDEE